MNYVKNAWRLLDNYVIAPRLKRPSTAGFWYLPEPPNVTTKKAFANYKKSSQPVYLIDYRQKLAYSLTNAEGIIVLPYAAPILHQINPEAAFQYALGLHDQFVLTQDAVSLERFWQYCHYFYAKQNASGLWSYDFDWFGSKAPWYSALAQARGASVMLRAYLLSGEDGYLNAAKSALAHFNLPITQGGFRHHFALAACDYFEEYPQTPTGVINGFMAALISIWEVQYWTKDPKLINLWEKGLSSLEKMLPAYSNGWWSLYDLDEKSPMANVNSPRYHLLEIHYLQILSLLSESSILETQLNERMLQYQRVSNKLRALALKTIRKIIYR